jgi:hypothetical protein
MSLIASDQLDSAVSDRCAVTLTGAGDEISLPAKFLSLSADPPGVWVQVTTAPAAAAAAATELLASAPRPLTGCFLRDGARYLFETTVVKRDRHHWLTDSLYVDALLLSLPDEVTSPEFRRNRRYRISDSVGGIHAQVFRGGPGGEPEEIAGALWDLSAGGVSFVCSNAKSVADVTTRQPVVVVLNFRGKRMLLLARRTHVRQFAGRPVRLGLKFDFSRPASAPAESALLRACNELEQQALARRG